jgi:hypothetical protein
MKASKQRLGIHDAYDVFYFYLTSVFNGTNELLNFQQDFYRNKNLNPLNNDENFGNRTLDMFIVRD